MNHKTRREEFFANKVCDFCGAPEKLHLHHVDKKTKISHNIWGWEDEKREEEIAKCIVLCISCHTRLHNRERPPRPLKHGTSTGYRRGCRCETCRQTETARVMKWREKHEGWRRGVTP